MTKSLIPPRTLRGFRDYLPEAMLPREALLDTCRRVYRQFGFAPIDTPALELFEILAGKGSEETDRQMYHFLDQGERHVGLRFDLTVPLARFVSQHSQQLGMPFKRYHMATVWRGENPQAGRYREFMQCDFDTIGTTSLASDIETGLVIVQLLEAIGFDDFQVRINNRQILNGLLDHFQLREHSTEVLRAIDKLPKLGQEVVAAELREKAGCNEQQVGQILAFAQISGENEAILQQLQELGRGSELAEQGCEHLRAMLAAFAGMGLPKGRIQLDPSIARGLDYYTGVIFETFLGQLPAIGSVCSGGRYDHLTEMFTKEKLPGVGASLGLDRLLAAMEQLEMLPHATTPAQVLVAHFGETHQVELQRLAHGLRRHGLNVEFYPDAKKLGAQFKYADRRGFAAVVVVGPDDWAGQQAQVKWLAAGVQDQVPLDENYAELASHLLGKLQN